MLIIWCNGFEMVALHETNRARLSSANDRVRLEKAMSGEGHTANSGADSSQSPHDLSDMAEECMQNQRVGSCLDV